MKLLYISGPYSAPTYPEVRFNVHEMARTAAKCMERGWAVISPCGNSHAIAKYIDRTHADWILLDLELLDRCDAILMMKDWEKSKGARTEHSYALSKNITVYYETDGIPSSI